MSVRAEDQKAELIARVVARAQNQVEGLLREQATRFIPELYRHVPTRDLRRSAEEDLGGAAMSLLELAQRRAPGVALVRVLNPRPEEHGWKSGHTIIEIINDDMPFLVDSVIAELTRLEVTVHLVIHPIVRVVRNAAGELETLATSGEAPPVVGAEASVRSESWMHVEVAEQSIARHEQMASSLVAVLADVRASFEDWPLMRSRCLEIISELEANPPPLPATELAEGAALLRWIEDDHFTFLGYREYQFEGEGDEALARVVESSGLGVLRDSEARLFDGIRNFGRLPEDVRHFLREPRLLIITKANQRSRVHRAVVYDAIAVKAFDELGRVTGERVLVGLLTSAAYSRSPLRIPTLREKVQRTIERAGFEPRSHDAKTLLHILETFPRDELFQIGEDELLETATGILHLQERQRVALFARRDPFERFVSCLVYVPRDRFDTKLRLQFQEVLSAAWKGKVTAYYTHLTDSTLARLQFIVKTVPGRVPKVDLVALEEQLIDRARSWTDRLQAALVESRGEEQGLLALKRFGPAFPSAYQEHFSELEAVADIGRIEDVCFAGGLAMNLFRPPEDPESSARFKVYGCGPTVPLSDILPMLENLGFKVIDEIPYLLSMPPEDGRVWIRDFAMSRVDGAAFDIAKVRDDLHEVFAAVWRGEAESDGFNRLVLAGLDLRGVTAVRAWAKYLRQAQIPFSQSYMEQTLASHPAIAELVVALFVARFDPSLDEDRDSLVETIRTKLEHALESVSNLDEDRILRRFVNVVESMLRTNFFQQTGGAPKAYLSFKLDSRAIEELPLPRPFREIWVYSPRMEAIHLRGGKVARGGIRWSDRREDFRTEVLGLMKAQMVKNAVIVPVGSKGGFVCKQLPVGGTRDELAAEVESCYRTMMCGLLDLTDNRLGEEVVPPPQVVRADEDDPYLVVAADKGTASFSDLANSVAAEYGFWLGDAFASGGSAGYDHKKMGITARGAWEGVKRHFRELGKDIQHQGFTVAGVGDMSGDVFGNGMLLSRQIRLVAAFDHRHVFLDPNPDPDVSWRERRRLFETARSSWADYAPELISEGGGVFDRRAKSIPLSPQVQKLLGLKAAAAPHEVMKAILRLEVELMWFGGIGTYVKSSDESHADVGDRANDALRIDADDLRARVVGEGANLGMTQRARIEAGLKGVRINTDFIDNSAGVDTSDHEVNIKILLSEVERSGDMTRPQRDSLLAEMTDEVAELVLRDNYLQTQSITVTQQLGPRLVDRLARWIRTLEKSGRLDRGIEFLPDDEELADRITTGRGLTRPELAIVLAYSKIALYQELLDSDLPDDPAMFADLRLYFPTQLRDRFAESIGRHRLRRELVATMVTNGIVNRVGPSFVHEVGEKTGMPPADVARAYVVAREVFRIRGLWAGIEALDTLVPAAVQAAMLADCGRLIERATVWLLRTCSRPINIATTISTYATGVAEIQDNLDELLSRHGRKWLKDEAKRLVQDKVPEDLARRIAALGLIAPACELVRVAKDTGVGIAVASRTYFALGDRFGFDWLRRAALRLPAETVWDKLAATAIVDELASHQADLTRKVLAEANGGEVEVPRWARSRRLDVARTDQLVAELQAGGSPSFAMLAVANRQLKSLAT